MLTTQIPLMVTSTLALLDSFGNPVGKFTNANVVGVLVLLLLVVELVDDAHAHNGSEKTASSSAEMSAVA